MAQGLGTSGPPLPDSQSTAGTATSSPHGLVHLVPLKRSCPIPDAPWDLTPEAAVVEVTEEVGLTGLHNWVATLLRQIPLLLSSKEGLMGAVPMAQSSRPSQSMIAHRICLHILPNMSGSRL